MAKKPIYVVLGETKIPFLRGILTQSLLDVGLNFKEAYAIANKTRNKLKDQTNITRKKIKKIVIELLRKEFGEEVALGYIYRSEPSPPTIIVEGGEPSIPFSKGILARSILASGLDHGSAYEVAKLIEEKLAKKEGTVSNRFIRQMTYQTLMEKYGLSYAQRYLIWRKYKNSDKPVIILMGGPTGSGKTSLSAELAHRLGFTRLICTDSVRQIMRIMFSKDLLPSIHSSSYDAWKQLSFPITEKDDPVIISFREQSVRVSAGIRALIDRAIEENYNMILDGVHIVPGFINFSSYRAKAHIFPLTVVVLDKEIYRQRFVIRKELSPRRPYERYLANFDSIIKIQNFLIEMAEQYNYPIISNIDFEKTVITIIKLASEFMLKKNKKSLNLELIDK